MQPILPSYFFALLQKEFTCFLFFQNDFNYDDLLTVKKLLRKKIAFYRKRMKRASHIFRDTQVLDFQTQATLKKFEELQKLLPLLNWILADYLTQQKKLRYNIFYMLDPPEIIGTEEIDQGRFLSHCKDENFGLFEFYLRSGGKVLQIVDLSLKEEITPSATQCFFNRKFLLFRQ